MCNTCNRSCCCGCNNGTDAQNNNGCGCNLCNEIGRALNNLFPLPTNDNGCGCNRNRSGCGCNRCNRCNCCRCNENRSGCGCGADLSSLTDCGNYDAYYARQYGLFCCR